MSHSQQKVETIELLWQRKMPHVPYTGWKTDEEVIAEVVENQNVFKSVKKKETIKFLSASLEITEIGEVHNHW